ncbi:hypothetical protein WN944_022174 [Citrus x changshan-huyou]|uniref:Uncharacterized protein n=1 Tax=Citrus x changshan-huyou TaxID=2935761 RepID=A0AAP0R0A1_9ROSI
MDDYGTERKPKFVVEKENTAAAERNQRSNIPVTSRSDALSEDLDTNNTVEVAVTIPNLEPLQRQPKSVTDHFHTRKNLPLKTPSILKPHNQLSKGKQVTKSQHPQPHSTQTKEPFEDKDEGDIKSMEDYAGDPQFAFGNNADATMSDDDNSFVNETPEMCGEAELELCA